MTFWIKDCSNCGLLLQLVGLTANVMKEYMGKSEIKKESKDIDKDVDSPGPLDPVKWVE